MRRAAVVVPLGLSLAACGGARSDAPVQDAVEQITSNPPEPVVPEVAPSPAPAPTSAPDPSLPTWDEIPSGHPPGATNPPAPVLLVMPTGECHKAWVSPFMPASLRQDRVLECPNPDEAVGDCGPRVQCPERAAELLATWKAEHPG